MKIDLFHNPKLRTNLGRTSNKNFLGDRLIKSVYKFAKLVIETNSKVQEPKTYNKAINDLIHRNNWRKPLMRSYKI